MSKDRRIHQSLLPPRQKILPRNFNNRLCPTLLPPQTLLMIIIKVEILQTEKTRTNLQISDLDKLEQVTLISLSSPPEWALPLNPSIVKDQKRVCDRGEWIVLTMIDPKGTIVETQLSRERVSKRVEV